MHSQKKGIMEKEVDCLITYVLAKPSMSPWAFPCIFVPKSDGLSRFYTDFRKVNQMTIKDFP